MRRLALLVLFALVVAACGGDDDDSSEASDTTLADTEQPAAPLTPAEDDPLLDAVTVEEPAEAEGEPTAAIDGELSTDVTVRRVLTEGEGKEAADGAAVDFHFVAYNGRTGERFDGTRPGESVNITMDPQAVLPGIYRSLIGVQPGARVLSAIAPADAFGAQGGLPEQALEADDTVVFVMDVIDVTVPLDRAEGEAVDPPEGLPAVELAENGEPTITLPDGDPPTELVGQQLIVGDGPVVEAGQSITAHYTGIIWSGGEQFDSSWERGAPATFPIGTGDVITGWDETLVGQTVGSQMLLVLPPEKGYGTDGNPQAGIEGTDTLVFVVDILATA